MKCITIVWTTTIFLIVILPNHLINAGPDAVFSRLHRLISDYEPEGILDIGANVGKWSKNIHNMYSNATILMLEASNLHIQALQDTVNNVIGKELSEYKIAVMTNAIGDKVTWYESTTGHTGNSIYKENTKHFTNIKPIERITSTVDNEVSKSILKDKRIDIIKIDVQGAELVVLEGARQTLNQATFIQLELSVVDFNSGGACYYNVDEYLRNLGYRLFDFGDQLKDLAIFKYSLGQYDALYINTNSIHAPAFIHDINPFFCESPSERFNINGNSVSSSRGTSTSGSRVLEEIINPLSTYGDDVLQGYIQEKTTRRNFFILLVGFILGIFVSTTLTVAISKFFNHSSIKRE